MDAYTRCRLLLDYLKILVSIRDENLEVKDSITRTINQIENEILDKVQGY